MHWNSTQLLTDTTLTVEQVKTSGCTPLPSSSVKPTTPVISPLNTRILAVKASIKRPYADKYTSKSITSPLLPWSVEASVSLTPVLAHKSYDHWMQWARDTQPENDGDHLIQALLRLDCKFINSLSARLFGYIAFGSGQWSYGQMNRAALEILAACAWRQGGHFVTFDVDRYSHKYPKGMGKRSRCANHKHIASLIGWANRNYALRCSAANERQRLLDLVQW